MLAVVAVLRALNGAVKDLDRSVAAHLGEHPDGAIFTSLPRSGQINAAQMLAEWGDCRQAYAGPTPSPPSPATPVTGNPASTAPSLPLGLQQAVPRAITTFADNSRHASPWAAQVYTTPGPPARTTPRHPHPGPRLDPRHLAMLVNGVPYNPARHRAAAALAKQTAQPIAA